MKGLVLWGVMNLSKGKLKVGGAYIIEGGVLEKDYETLPVF